MATVEQGFGPEVFGVVLAGGKASRMPNKLYLSTREHKPLIGHAIEYLIAQGLTHILISVNDTDAEQVMSLVRHLNYGVKIAACLDRQTGVVEALSAVVNHPLMEGGGVHKLMIVCCDNVYPLAERMAPQVYASRQSWAVVRTIDPHHVNGFDSGGGELDFYHPEEGWMKRDGYPQHDFALTTPWILDMESLSVNLCEKAHSLLYRFNEMDVQPYHLEADGWADLGTKKAYASYWREEK